jgi:hypothetical protein
MRIVSNEGGGGTKEEVELQVIFQIILLVWATIIIIPIVVHTILFYYLCWYGWA